eukprot:403355146
MKVGQIQQLPQAPNNFLSTYDNTQMRNNQIIEPPQTSEQIVNAKNAFDFDIDFVQNLSLLLSDKIDNESQWLRASASLDAGTKIYAYRVDQVHQETYKILGGLHRQEQAARNTSEASTCGSLNGGDQELFTMLNGLADQDSSIIQNSKKNNKKPQQSIQFTGGERTLEKDPKNLDVTRFDIEAEIDPLFRQRTARFDESGARNLLINITHVDKGLNIQLDSEIAEVNRQKLFKPFKRKQDKSIEEVELEQMEQFKVQKWNQEYMLLCKSVFKAEGVDTLCGQRMSRELDMKRKEIYDYMGGVRVKQKRNRDQHEQMSNISEMSLIQSEMMTEMDELDKFIQEVIEKNDQKVVQTPIQPPQINATTIRHEPRQQQVHHEGIFLAGDFESQTMSHSRYLDPFQQNNMSEQNTMNQQNHYDEDFVQAQQENDQEFFNQGNQMRQDSHIQSDYGEPGGNDYDNEEDRIHDEIQNEIQLEQMEDQAEMSLFEKAVINTDPITAEELKNQNKRLTEEKIDKSRISDLKDAQKLLMIDGRFKMNNQLGTGNQKVFDDMRKSLATGDGDSVLDQDLLRRDKQKREIKKRMIDDEVLQSYDKIQPSMDTSHKSNKDKKNSTQPSQAQKSAQNAGHALEKYIKETRIKDIKPQHLTRFESKDISNLATRSLPKFNLQFYETHPLKRLSRLFCRTSWMKISEIDPANIDYHSIQNLNFQEGAHGNMEQSDLQKSQFTNNQSTFDLKLYEQYLGVSGPSIQEELNNPNLTLLNPEDAGSQISSCSYSYQKPLQEMSNYSHGGSINNNELSHISFIQESTNRVMSTLNDNGKEINGDYLSELVPHRKHQNLQLLIQDFSINQIGGNQDKIVNANLDPETQPQKRKLKLFQHILDKHDEQEQAQLETEQQLMNRILQAKKFDIKLLKEEIWKMLENQIPRLDHRTQRKIENRQIGVNLVEELVPQDPQNDLSFVDLIEAIPMNCSENQDLITTLSIHTTFVCLLHLANEHRLQLKQIVKNANGIVNSNLISNTTPNNKHQPNQALFNNQAQTSHFSQMGMGMDPQSYMSTNNNMNSYNYNNINGNANVPGYQIIPYNNPQGGQGSVASNVLQLGDFFEDFNLYAEVLQQ